MKSSIITNITNKPYEKFLEYKEKINRNLSFEDEFKIIVDLLIDKLNCIKDFNSEINNSLLIMISFCKMNIENISTMNYNYETFGLANVKYSYISCWCNIINIMIYLDSYQRSLYKNLPKKFNFDRHSYIIYNLINRKDVIFIPVIDSLSFNDFIFVRGVPIFFIGINLDIQLADGFYQTSLEFMTHDFNHSRRMIYNNFRYYNENKSKYNNIENLYYDSTKFIENKIKPIISNNEITSLILFEIGHEKGFILVKDEIIEMLYSSVYINPYEFIKSNNIDYNNIKQYRNITNGYNSGINNVEKIENAKILYFDDEAPTVLSNVLNRSLDGHYNYLVDTNICLDTINKENILNSSIYILNKLDILTSNIKINILEENINNMDNIEYFDPNIPNINSKPEKNN